MKNRVYYIVVAVLSLVAFVTVFNYGGYGGCLGVGGFNQNSGRIFASTSTNPATNVTSDSATLNGTVNPDGVDTFVYFQYGTTMTYGTITDYQFIGSGTSPVNVTANINELSPNTNYNFRLVVKDYNGPTYGNNMRFITGN
ncbi:MAG: hypothetical protein V1871_06570 [Planctomycetota bacterium]